VFVSAKVVLVVEGIGSQLLWWWLRRLANEIDKFLLSSFILSKMLRHFDVHYTSKALKV